MSTLLTSLTTLDAELPCRVLAYRESIPVGLSGAYVALTGAERTLQIGLLSDVIGWQSLGHVNEPDAGRARQRVVQVSSELVTRLVRAFRGRIADEGEISLGLPLFVDGGVALDGRLDVQAADVVIGNTRALLVLLSPRSAPASVAFSTEETAGSPLSSQGREAAG